MIIGIAFVGVVQLFTVGTYANQESGDLTTALGLAGNIHEMSLGLAYTDLISLDGITHSPPVDASNTTLDDMAGWTQQVSASYVDPNRLSLTVPKTSPEPTILITVTISHNGNFVYSTHWLAAASQWP